MCFDYSHKNILTIESPSYAGFIQFLFGSSFQLGKIQAGFSNLEKIQKYKMIVIGGPRESQFSPDEIMILVHYVKHGGNLLLIYDEGGDYGSNCNLSELTQYFGFTYEPDILFDSVNFQNEQNRMVISEFEPHPLTQNLDALVQASACSIKINREAEKEKEIEVYPIATAGLNCYRTKWDGKEWIPDLDAPNSILAVGVDFYKGRVIGLSTVSMFSSLSSSYGYYARSNQDFIANIFNWLLQSNEEGKKRELDTKLISIPIKINYFLWMEQMVAKQDWDKIEDVINFSLKHLKQNYQEIMQKYTIPNSTLHNNELTTNSKKIENSSPNRISDTFNSSKNRLQQNIRKFSKESDSNLEDIMKTLQDITGGEVGGDFNLEELKQTIAPIQIHDENLTDNAKSANIQEERDAQESPNCVDVENLDFNEEHNFEDQIKNKKLAINCADEELKEEESQESVKSTPSLEIEDSVDSVDSKMTLRAIMDAKLDDAFNSMDSIDEFQKKINEFKKLTEKDDPIK